MTKKVSDDEINQLKRLTDEVFLISNKPLLPLVQKMKHTGCTIMSTGLKKIVMEYCYCKTCDKENKFPMCTFCSKACHKDHIISDIIPPSEDHPLYCMCGYKCHNMGKKEKEVDNDEQNSIKCCFNQLSQLAECYEYYVGVDNKKVCVFCYHFCCHNLISGEEEDEASFNKELEKYEFKRVRVSREEFEYGVQKNEIVCDCLSLPDSKHKSPEQLSIFINELNVPSYNDVDNDDYFSSLSPVLLINLFFNATELFENIYTGFISEYNEFMKQLGDKNEKNQISSIFGVGYSNFANNANNCKYNLYFNEKINIYFTTRLTKTILERNLKPSDNLNSFVLNYLKGFIKFRLGSYFEAMPRYLLTDIINMNIFQRIIYRQKCKKILLSCGLLKENLIETLINAFKKIIHLRPDLDEIIDLLNELSKLLKFYARFFLVSKEEIHDVCKVLEDLFGYFSLVTSNDENESGSYIPLKLQKVKFIKNIVKTIAYFTFIINDDTYLSFFGYNNGEETEKNFFQSFTENNKLIAKIMIYSAEFIRKEYEKALQIIEDEKTIKKQLSTERTQTSLDEENDMTNEEYQIALMRIIYTNEIILDLTLCESDCYIPNLKRVINQNLPNFLKMLPQDFENTNKFLKTIEDDRKILENLYFDFFNGQNIKMQMLEDYANSSMLKIISAIMNENENTQLKSIFSNLIKREKNIITSPVEFSFDPKNIEVKAKKIPTSQFLLNKSTIIYTITKILKLSKNKSVYSDTLCENMIKFCFAFIADNQDNAIIGLTTPILINLTKIPRRFLCCLIDYLIFGLKIFIKYNCEFTFSFLFAKFGFLIYHKTTAESKRNGGKDLPNSPICLKKLFKLLQLIYMVKSSDQKQFLEYVKPKLQELMQSFLIQEYKAYLLEIAEASNENRERYIRRKTFDNEVLFDKHFGSVIAGCPLFNSDLMFKIFLRYMRLINKTFDVNALEDLAQFLKDYLTPQEIIKILSITTLHLNLRLELIKYFRMIYIDLAIEMDKMSQYRYIFQKELETDVAEVGDSLIPLEQMKIFIFLQHLMKVGDYISFSEESTYEYEILFFEIKNIKQIVTHSKKVDQKTYMAYIENGIMLPIKIYMNKIFSMIMEIKGEGLLKLYRFCFYLLKMKQFIIESKIISANTEKQKESVLNNSQFINEESLVEIKEDINTITNPLFPILNYLEIYKLITKHIMSLIENPTSQELVLYFSEYERFEENIKQGLKGEFEKRGINFNDTVYKNAWNAFESYMEQKSRFEKSSIKSNFDENFIDGEASIRSIIMKYLFFLSTNKLGSFSQEGINMLLTLLKSETDESQEAILALAEKSIKGNKKAVKTHNYTSGKRRQIEDFFFLSKQGFDCILSSIFSQYNPTSLELSDDYYRACHIIKLFKFLCEDHNQNFQHRLMCEISFEIGKNKYISFYDMMLFITDKIITISSWETANNDGDVQDYFYGIFSCIIEMLIEIVQGTEPDNFNVFLAQEETEETPESDSSSELGNKNDNPDEMPTYEKGKALRIFLNNIKGIMFDDVADSDTIFNVRKDLMDFLLAFMEEYNCPREIKNQIMSCYHPSMIIKSICNVLKKYYLKEVSLEKGKSIFIDEENFKRDRTNRIIDQNFQKKAAPNNKPKMRKLKQLKFNEILCAKFTQLYFEDPEFSQTKTFDLCNAFYHYFILTYIQYKNEETLDFWNKVHSQTPEALDAFNKRTKITNEQENMTGPVSDDSDMEAYYVIKFFKEVSKYVLVKIKPEDPPVYVVYTIHPYSKYLSSDSKSEFLRTVERKNRYTKLYDLMESSEFFMLEIIYNWNNLRRSALLRKSTELNYHLLGYITFLISFCLNFVFLCCLHESGESYYGNKTLNIVQYISYACSGIVLIIICFWFATKLKLYYEIEKAKYKEHHKDKNGLDDSQLTFFDRIKIRYQAIVGKGELTPFFIFLVFTLLGSVSKNLLFFYSFSLLSVMSLSQTLNNIALSIVLKGRQLLWTSLFTLVLLYVYAGWGFYYQRERFYEINGRDKPDHMCKSLLYCFLTMINNGLRWHAGIGLKTRSESAFLHLADFIHRFIYDLLFFWLMEGVMLHIVFGIILDSFGELRQAHYVIEKDIANNCFICNIVKDECEKNNESFKDHCENVHNVWDYAFYMITLRMSDPQDLNAVNSRNREMIMSKQLGWFPEYKSGLIEEEENEEEEDNEE